MRIISLITLLSTVERILLHLDLPHRPPGVSPARGPPPRPNLAAISLRSSMPSTAHRVILWAPSPMAPLPPSRPGCLTAPQPLRPHHISGRLLSQFPRPYLASALKMAFESPIPTGLHNL